MYGIYRTGIHKITSNILDLQIRQFLKSGGTVTLKIPTVRKSIIGCEYKTQLKDALKTRLVDPDPDLFRRIRKVVLTCSYLGTYGSGTVKKIKNKNRYGTVRW